MLNVEERGRYWVVGAAYKQAKFDTAEKQNVSNKAFTPELLALAKKAKMNTELRRNVFCTILSSEVILFIVI